MSGTGNFNVKETLQGDANKETKLNTALNNTINAVSDTATINFTSDADKTVSTSGDPSEFDGMAHTLRVLVTSSGSLTAMRNLIVPTANKHLWSIKNNTTGGKSITVKTSAGTGVLIENGSEVLLYQDGTNVIAFGGGVRSCDVQIFTASGTWTKPTGAKHVEVILLGGGGGGGSGRKGAAASDRAGGTGGSGGGISKKNFLGANLGATETVTVGTGGTGGASQTTNSTNGNNGTAGGNSEFGTTVLVRAFGGGLGPGGTASNGSAVNGASGDTHGIQTAGGNSGAGNISTGSNGTDQTLQPLGARGGGGGGGISSANTESNGGRGGQYATVITVNGGIAGVTGGPTAGGNGNALLANDPHPGSGGGGGAGKRTGTPGNGGNGGNYGAGGGGGGAAEDSATNSGAGGNGANGIVVVITHF